MNIQFKKGVLELCVLSMLQQSDRYGYELADALSAHIEIADGTVYPILRKLKEDGYVSTYLREASGGPPRKYYALTPQGWILQAELESEWNKFVGSVRAIVEAEGGKT